MPLISKITEKDKKHVSIFFEGNEYCFLKKSVAQAAELNEGDFIEYEAIDALQFKTEKDGAFDKTLTYITAAMKTSGQIKKFLRDKRYVWKIVDYVIEKLTNYNFVNDYEYCRQYIASVGKRKGLRLIEIELKRKGANESAIERAVGETDCESEYSAAKTVASKYLRNKEVNVENKRKACKYLLSKGFSYSSAVKALDLLSSDIEDE